MNRESMIESLGANPDKVWDILIIGGGATGLGAGVDAASRGYDTLLLEQSDFAKGTSSRSTKLVHGGVRYLAQGNIRLVFEALHERGLLRKNAPHLVENQAFIIPNYKWWNRPFYTIGMKIYDMMSGKLSLGSSGHISKKETIKQLPNLSDEGLNGGVKYYDGQFDDARLAINLAQTMIEKKGTAINYFEVTDLLKNNDGMISGVAAIDKESGKTYEIRAKVVVNATGVFVDNIIKMNNVNTRRTIRPSQGVHIVLDKSFLHGSSAIMIPRTSDGRVLFAVPWHGKVVVGTTDTPMEEATLEPRALENEIEFILATAAQYLKKAPQRKEVLSIFAGLRPLAAPSGRKSKTKEISRGHKLLVTKSGLITMTGGKWTTYRKMGEDIIDKAAMIAGLRRKKCVTKNMPIHGYVANNDFNDHLYIYGADRAELQKLINNNPGLGQQLHPNLPFTKAEVVWAVRNEMARNLDDVLARRVRALYLDARASIEMAPKVASLIASELNFSNQWIEEQIKEYSAMGSGYLPRMV